MARNNPNNGFSGFFTCMVDSYRLALGDFAVWENFSDDGVSDYLFVFYTVFFVGTLISMLILLNMVLAVMGAAFSKVKENEEAVIVRQNLKDVVTNYYRFDEGLKTELH